MAEESKRFPEIFLEVGKDINRSYRAIKTIRQPDGTLDIEIVGWGVQEYGIYMRAETNAKVLRLSVGGRCGSVRTANRTRIKASFHYTVDNIVENNLRRIKYGSLEIRKAN